MQTPRPHVTEATERRARTNEAAPRGDLARGVSALFLSIPGITGTLGYIFLDLNMPRGWQPTTWHQIWTYGIAVSLVLGFTSFVSTPAAIVFGVLFLKGGGGNRTLRRMIVGVLILATTLTVLFVAWLLMSLGREPVP
jgi:hypothetical protein